MIVRTHSSSDNRLILTICDSDLIGKVFEEGDQQLDLSSDYFKGEEMEDDKIFKLIQKAYSVNVVGKKSVEICIKAGVIDQENIAKIKGIPYAYMLRF